MIIIYFFYGLVFSGLGLATYLQMRRGGEVPLGKQLPWLAAFGFTYGAVGWVDMFMISETSPEIVRILSILRNIFQPLSGLLLLIFGWRILTHLSPLPSWTIFIPGLLIVPIAYIITFAATTFITPSPIDIPIDIWSRYLLYLPGSILAGAGFLRQWQNQKKAGYKDVSRLMLGAGLAFLFEAFIVGLVVPAAPYGPASYYNYDRTLNNAFTGEMAISQAPFGFSTWLDYDQVLISTGLPIQFWRLLSAIVVIYFIIRSLDVFEAIRKRQLAQLQDQRDQAERAALEGQIAARRTAENWSEALVNINRRIVDLEDVDHILLFILENACQLLNSDYIAIALYNPEQPALELKYFADQEHSGLVDPPRGIDNSIVLDTFFKNEAHRSSNSTQLEELSNICPLKDCQAIKVAVIPISLDTSPIGAMWVARQMPIDFSETDLIWLDCMADQVVIAIKHGLMTAHLQSLSVVEERGRIAREMHDGLAQILGYLNLQVQTLETLRKKENWERLDKELRNMRQAIQAAHADVRENILSLRTTLAHEAGLIPAISEYLDEFGIQTGIEVLFENQAGSELGISSIAEVQLVCILQETLANVRKHAQAQKVAVDLSRTHSGIQDQIHLIIDDDGLGFVQQESRHSFGLQTMRERAQSVGGHLQICSKPGYGTQIHCILPCVPQEQLSKTSVLIGQTSVTRDQAQQVGIVNLP